MQAACPNSLGILRFRLAGRVVLGAMAAEVVVRCIAEIGNGEAFAAGLTDGTIELWDAVSGSEPRPIASGGQPLGFLAIAPDGTTLA